MQRFETATHQSKKPSAPEVIARLQAIIFSLLDPLIDDDAFALVDFPDHPNVGDSAIWLGEIAFFRHYKKTPAYVCGKDNLHWQRLQNAVPTGTIFIHGGGNFGDVWPEHQRFRLEILRRFPGRLVVQLPQSIHFGNGNITATQQGIAAHGNFVLLVRDAPSLDLATRHFKCRTWLCPDMAFCIGVQPRRGTPAHAELNLLRTDIESVGAAQSKALKPGSVTADWLDERRGLHAEMRLRTALSALAGSGAYASRGNFENIYYRSLAQQRTERGLKLLSTAQHVTTDRLHAHILSTLLSIPHTVLDNRYGKISRFMQAWDTDWRGVDIYQPA